MVGEAQLEKADLAALLSVLGLAEGDVLPELSKKSRALLGFREEDGEELVRLDGGEGVGGKEDEMLRLVPYKQYHVVVPTSMCLPCDRILHCSQAGRWLQLFLFRSLSLSVPPSGLPCHAELSMFAAVVLLVLLR